MQNLFPYKDFKIGWEWENSISKDLKNPPQQWKKGWNL
jgi:hypothetical protein